MKNLCVSTPEDPPLSRFLGNQYEPYLGVTPAEALTRTSLPLGCQSTRLLLLPGLFLGLCGLGTGSWVLVIHLVALIKNWKHGLRQNVDHADKHFTYHATQGAHNSTRQVSAGVKNFFGRCQKIFWQVLARVSKGFGRCYALV